MARSTGPGKIRAGYEHLRLQDTIGFLLSDATRTMTRAFTTRIAAHGIGLGIFQFLRVLWEEDGLTQKELADRMRMRGPTIVAAVKQLEWNGYVRRVNDPADGRKVQLFLTETGHQLYDLVMPEIEAIRRLMLADFSDAEQEQLKQMLQRMRGNLSPTPAKLAPRAQPRTAGRRAATKRAAP